MQSKVTADERMWIREYRQDKASIQIFNILFSSKCYRSTQFQVVVADHFQGVLESIPFTAEDGKKDIFHFPASVRLSTKSAERAGSFHRQDPTLVLAGTSVCRTVCGDRCCFGFPSGHERSHCHRIPPTHFRALLLSAVSLDMRAASKTLFFDLSRKISLKTKVRDEPKPPFATGSLPSFPEAVFSCEEFRNLGQCFVSWPMRLGGKNKRQRLHSVMCLLRTYSSEINWN